MPNPEIPQYQEREQITPPGLMDTTSGIKETPSYAQEGLNIADKFLSNELGNVMGDLGAKAGEAQGKDFQSLPELTPEMAKYNQAALPVASQVAMNGLQNEAQGYYNQLMATGLSPDSNMIFKAQMQASIKSYTDSVDPKMAPQLIKSSNALGQSYLTRINQQTETLQRNQGLFNYQKNLDESAASNSTLAFDGGLDGLSSKPKTAQGKAAAQNLSNLTNQYMTTWATSNIPGEARARGIHRAGFELAKNAYAGAANVQLNQAMENTKNKTPITEQIQTLNALRNNVLKNPDLDKFNLSLEEKEQIQKGVAATQNSLKNALSISLPSSSMLKGQFIAQIKQTGKPPTASQLNLLEGTNNGPQAVDQVNAFAQANSYVQDRIQNGNPQSWRRAANRLNANDLSKAFGDNSTLLPESKQATASYMSGQLKGMIELIHTQPHEAIQRTIPSATLKSVWTNISDAQGRQDATDYESNPSIAMQRVLAPTTQTAIRSQQDLYARKALQFGLSPNTVGAFNQDDASAMAGIINTDTIPEKQQAMANLQANLGPHFANALTSLTKNGLRLDTAILLNGANQGIKPPIVQETLNSIHDQSEITKSGNQTAKSDLAAQQHDFMTNTLPADLSGDQQKIVNALPADQASTYKKLIWDLHYTRNRDNDPRSSVTNCASDLLSMSLHNTGNGKILIPNVVHTVGPNHTVVSQVLRGTEKDMLVTDAKSLANQLQGKEFDNINWGPFRKAMPGVRDNTLKDEIKSNAIWKTRPNGSGAYLTLHGIPLITNKNNLYGFSYANSGGVFSTLGKLLGEAGK